MRRTGLNHNEALVVFVIGAVTVHVRPEPVPLDQEVLGPVREALLCRELPRSTVILKRTTMKSSTKSWADTDRIGDFNQEIANWEKSPKAGAESGIFRFRYR